MNILDTPKEFHNDLTKVVNYLSSVGCSEVFLFGSLARNEASNTSDIDIAVRGIDPSDFFSIYGELLMISEHTVDLVDLDLQQPLGETLLGSGELRRVS